MSVSMSPAQARALARLADTTHAAQIDVAEGQHRGLWVTVFVAPDRRAHDPDPCWFYKISELGEIGDR